MTVETQTAATPQAPTQETTSGEQNHAEASSRSASDEALEGALAMMLSGKDPDADGASEPESSPEEQKTEPVQKKAAPGALSSDPAKAMEELRQLAISGEFDQLIQALGVNPGALRVPDGRFRKLKQITRQQKAARDELVQREVALNQFAQQLQSRYTPIHEAAQAIEDGDYDAALRAITGGKLDAMAFTEQLARQLATADPNTRRELAKLRKEQERQNLEREQFAQQQRELAERQHAAATEEHRRESQAQISEILSASGDPDLADVATHPRFVGTMLSRVEAAIRRGWEPNAETMADEVVELARKTLLDLRRETAILHRRTASQAETGQSRGSAANPHSGESRPTEVLRARPEPESESPDDRIDSIVRSLFGR